MTKKYLYIFGFIFIGVAPVYAQNMDQIEHDLVEKLLNSDEISP